VQGDDAIAELELAEAGDQAFRTLVVGLKPVGAMVEVGGHVGVGPEPDPGVISVAVGLLVGLIGEGAFEGPAVVAGELGFLRDQRVTIGVARVEAL